MKTPISFRLRKDVDADLIQALGALDQKKLADLCRDGLRLMLGIRMTRQAHIVERPIQQETVTVKSVGARIGNWQGQGKPLIKQGG